MIKSLNFLHSSCNPRVLHYDLKTANVLFDEDFEPRLGDCGLVRLIPNVGKATGYMLLPSVFRVADTQVKSDVFSFGMMLAVLLTGKDPFGPNLWRDERMEIWLKQLQRAGKASEQLDKSIVRKGEEEDEMLIMALRIAVCLSYIPAERPSSEAEANLF